MRTHTLALLALFPTSLHVLLLLLLLLLLRLLFTGRGAAGMVSCVACGEAFTTSIHQLCEPIDVYHDWLDACEEKNKE
jgi:hypothetical protein